MTEAHSSCCAVGRASGGSCDDDDRAGDDHEDEASSFLLPLPPCWTIPVIDLATSADEEAEGACEVVGGQQRPHPHQQQHQQRDELELAHSLVRALETIGFVTLLHHGVDTDGALQSAQQFFELPLHSKLQCPYQGHVSNRGYLPMGSESHQSKGGGGNETPAFDAKETLELDDTSATMWPTEFPEDSLVRTTLLQYYDDCHRLHLRLLRLAAIGLGLDSEIFASQCNARHCNLRLLHYPATTHTMRRRPNVQRGIERGVVIRGACHTDFGTLTLLAQDSVGGLRVQPRGYTTTSGQQWITVPPTPGALVVNVGDMLQRWTNDRLVATPHQVVGLLEDSPEHEVGEGDDDGSIRGILPERYSVAFFCNANPDTDLRPIPSLIPHGEAPKFEPITAREYLTQRLAATIHTSTTDADL